MLQSEYDVIVKNKRLKILLIVLTAIMVAVVLFVTVKFAREYLSKPTDIMTGVPPKDTDTPPKSSPEPTKTEFADRFPTDFPSDIPVEKDAKFTQSYILDYPGQKQLSIVFPSVKTVKENYALYTDYAKKEGWTIINTEDQENLSFLYATKENMDINVTITTITMGSVIPKQDTGETEDGSMDGFPDKDIATAHAVSTVSVSVLKK
jgi:hypothetical protein